MKYDVDMNDEPLSYLLIQATIKTGNHLMALSDSSRQYIPETGRSTGAYIIFYQGGPIDHGTHFSVPVDQSSAESEYNAACTAGMDSSNFKMLIR